MSIPCLLKICIPATASLVQRSTFVYFAEHKFDRCQTCFCLIRAASVPLLKMLDVQKVRLRFISARLLASAPPICKSAGKAAHLLRRIMKSVRPCTLFMANFGKAEISLLFKPAASVPLLKMLNVSVLLRMADSHF